MAPQANDAGVGGDDAAPLTEAAASSSSSGGGSGTAAGVATPVSSHTSYSNCEMVLRKQAQVPFFLIFSCFSFMLVLSSFFLPRFTLITLIPVLLALIGPPSFSMFQLV